MSPLRLRCPVSRLVNSCCSVQARLISITVQLCQSTVSQSNVGSKAMWLSAPSCVQTMAVLLISKMDSSCSSPVPSRCTLCPLVNYIFPLRNPKSLSTNTTSTRSTSINDCEPRISDKDGDVDVEGDGYHDGARVANCLVVTTSPNGRPNLSTIHHAANGVSTLRIPCSTARPKCSLSSATSAVTFTTPSELITPTSAGYGRKRVEAAPKWRRHATGARGVRLEG
jgi:hypothetical protein